MSMDFFEREAKERAYRFALDQGLTAIQAHQTRKRTMKAHVEKTEPALDPVLVAAVARLLEDVTSRDLDAIADDIVWTVLQCDDLSSVVRDRLEVQKAFREETHLAPAATPRRAAVDIIKALHAVIRPRLSKERDL